MTVKDLYIEDITSHRPRSNLVWLNAHQNPLSPLTCKAQQNLSESGLSTSVSLFPIVYSSTTSSQPQLNFVPTKTMG